MWYRASRESSSISYAAQLTIQPVGGFENGDHCFLAAKSALPAVDEPPADVPSSPYYYYFCVATQVASLIAATSDRRLHFLALQHMPAMLCPQEVCCIPVALLTYIHTYAESQCNTISCLASRSATTVIKILTIPKLFTFKSYLVYSKASDKIVYCLRQRREVPYDLLCNEIDSGEC